MLRFTIRDVLLLTVIVALGVCWNLERRHSAGLAREVLKAEHDAQQSRLVIKNLYDDLDRIGQVLPQHGLTIEWSSKLRPTIQAVRSQPGRQIQ